MLNTNVFQSLSRTHSIGVSLRGQVVPCVMRFCLKLTHQMLTMNLPVTRGILSQTSVAGKQWILAEIKSLGRLVLPRLYYFKG